MKIKRFSVYVPDKKSEILGVRYNEVCTFNVLMKLCVERSCHGGAPDIDVQRFN
jgi:hypothetical protein